MHRTKPLQIYLKPGIKEDDLLLEVWAACRKSGRPQDIFRRMLRAGLAVMVENGEIPEGVVRTLHLDERVNRNRAGHAPAPLPAAYPHPSFPSPYLPPYWPWPAAAAHPAGAGLRHETSDPSEMRSIPSPAAANPEAKAEGQAGDRPQIQADVPQEARSPTGETDLPKENEADDLERSGEKDNGIRPQSGVRIPVEETVADKAVSEEISEASQDMPAPRRARIGDIM